MWTLEFWRSVAERAIKTAAQAAVLATGAGIANILTLDWAVFAGAAGGGALLSILTSLGSEASPFGNPGTASLTKSVEVAPDAPGKHATDRA